MLTEIPLLEDGSVDYSKVCVHNDFRLFPRLFNNLDDISKFIKDYDIDAPCTDNLLKLVKEDRLHGLTPTEVKFHLDYLFDYVFDVYRIPVDYTYKAAKEWIEDYIEGILFNHGVEGVKKRTYEGKIETFKNCREINKLVGREVEEINCYHNIDPNPFYQCGMDHVEQFWIRTRSSGIQPQKHEDEYYARVWVFEDKVKMFGCDDMSYTLFSDDKKELDDFVDQLKCCCSVWDFSFTELIHPKLEFTN